MAETPANFDFSAWVRLAQSDPDQFEASRLELIEAFLASVPEDRREPLRRFQWMIDRERERAKTPLGACVRLSEMMHERVHGDGGLREQLEGLTAAARGEMKDDEPRAVAEILEFPNRGENGRGVGARSSESAKGERPDVEPPADGPSRDAPTGGDLDDVPTA